MLVDDGFRGGVNGGLEMIAFPLGSSVLSEAFRGGVGFSELPDELSVNIRSLSLSDSSKNIRLWLRLLECMVKDEAKGLCRRASEIYPAFGASRLGRRNRWRRRLGSSRVKDEVDAIGLEEDGGRAKSVEEVGNEGRDEALGIAITGRPL
jgi:hypothetical protein